MLRDNIIKIYIQDMLVMTLLTSILLTKIVKMMVENRTWIIEVLQTLIAISINFN